MITDAMVERASKAVCPARWDSIPETLKGEILSDMRAALEAAIPPGWVLCPKEPTPKMRNAGRTVRQEGYSEIAIWDAMLAAASEPGA